MKRPSFFLSSTIFDLRDLRGAIKFYLEERGCQVSASEFNDFEKPVDVHSYEACLRVIEASDYFVLVIGARRGGWYDAKNRVSITQQEYRHARALSDAGKLKIITFVRADTWAFRETHKAELRKLHKAGLADQAHLARLNAKSTFADDPEFVIGFIDEVSRNEETKKALESGGPMPVGNWISPFTDFRDITDTLRTVLPLGLPVEEAVFRRAVRHELSEALKAGLIKHGETISSPLLNVEIFNASYRFKSDLRENDVQLVPGRAWRTLCLGAMWTLGQRFPLSVLPEALTSPTFLRFDLTTGGIVETDLFHAIHRLILEIRAANLMIDENVQKIIFKYSPAMRPQRSDDLIEVETVDVAVLLSFAYRCSNIAELSIAIISALDGGDFLLPELKPWSPVEGFEEEIASERVTPAEIDQYVHARTVRRDAK